MDISEYITQADNIYCEITASLPSELNLQDFGSPSFISAKVFSHREALIHRVHDLAGVAIQLAKEEKYIPSITMGSSILETTSALHLLNIKAKKFLDSKIDLNTLDDYLMRSMFGSKKQESKYSCYSIQNAVDELGTKHPDIIVLYDRCCEIVHPSWPGVQGSYTDLDSKNDILKLGKQYTKLTYKDLWQPITIGLMLFHDCYNEGGIQLEKLTTKLNGVKWA